MPGNLLSKANTLGVCPFPKSRVPKNVWTDVNVLGLLKSSVRLSRDFLKHVINVLLSKAFSVSRLKERTLRHYG